MDADSPFADEHPRLRPDADEEAEAIPGVNEERPDDAQPGEPLEPPIADGVDQAEGEDAALVLELGDLIGEALVVDASIPGASDPLDQTLTEFRCPKCGAGGKWTGPLTPDMLANTYTRGVNDATGLPNCIYCGTATDPVTFLKAEDAISQAAERLDQERAGDAARPLHQPSIPGILPAFDWRRAQLTTESLEETVAACERTWDEAKKDAADAKKEFDDAVDTLRAHIQAMHRARIDAEYQHGKDHGPIAPLPDGAPAAKGPCWTEQKTGRPCSICRSAIAAPTNGDTTQHVAAAAAIDANAGTLDAAGLAASIGAVTGIVVHAESLATWTPQDVKAVAQYLERVALVASSESGDTTTIEKPSVFGRPHEVGEMGGGCRVCGALMHQFAVAVGQPDGFALGQLVGLDCPGEPEAAAAPARQAKPRHAKPADRQKAKQAKGTKDHAAEQKVEGAQKAAAEKKKPAKAALKGAAKKRTTR